MMKSVACEFYVVLVLVASLWSSVSGGFLYPDKSEPERDPVCSLPLRRGSGSEEIQRFFYNGRKDRCEPFVYKGSGGNGNNFAVMSDCLAACRPMGKPKRGPVAELAIRLAEAGRKHSKKPTTNAPPPTQVPTTSAPPPTQVPTTSAPSPTQVPTTSASPPIQVSTTSPQPPTQDPKSNPE